MNVNGMYYITDGLKKVICECGGEWKDEKKRPVVCLIKSTENDELFWAIPMGKWNHRDISGINRINSFINRPKSDIRSCYYHVGRTTNKSIFFISDAIPITEKYILEEHLDINKNPYIIKNPKLIEELQRKLRKILSFENSKPNYFRQHITDVKKYLLRELAANNVDMYGKK